MSRETVLDPTRAPDASGARDSSAALGDLSGKRIALIKNAWPSWHTMLDRLAELIAQRYPGVNFVQYQVPNGSAAAPALLEQVAAENDGAIVGLANCGSCTAWSFHDALELRGKGTPSILVATKEFSGLVDAISKAKKADMPRVVLPLNPETVDIATALTMVDESVEEIIARLSGSSELESADGNASAAHANLGPIEITGDEDDDAAHELFYERGWTDGLPIRLPTARKVDALLAGLGTIDPDEVIADMPPTGFGVTYQTLAVNAVMAGATPELMPLLVATVRAACQPQLNLNGIATTTGPSTPAVIVNGPAGRVSGVHCGRGALGHGWRANLAIGRTLRLLINNVGGAKPDSVSKSIMGQPGRLSFCFAENEAESPWQPLHADRGMDPDDSAVTVFGATGSMNLLTPRQDVDAMLTLFADGLAFMGNPNVVMGRGSPAVLLSPGHARAMAAAGLSKQDVAREIWQRSTIPVERFPESAHPDASYEFVLRDGLVYAAQDPEHISIVVVGGPEPTHATLVPSHPSSIPVTCPVTPASPTG